MANGTVDGVELMQAMTNVGNSKIEDITDEEERQACQTRTDEIVAVLESYKNAEN